MKTRLPRWIRTLALAVVAPLAMLVGCQSKLIYHPQPYPESWLAEFDRTGGERLRFTTSQGAQTAFYRPPASANAQPRRLWLCFAGNASLALQWEFLSGLPHPDDALLMVDYPGYGLCAGRPNPKRIRENATTALAMLAAEKFNGRTPPLGLAGHSLGAAAALLAAQDFQAGRVLLLSPFTSLMEMGNRVLFPPLGHLTTHRFDNMKALANAKGPPGEVVIFHGAQDEIIPVEMGRRLAESMPQVTRFIPLPGARHNDLFALAGPGIRAAMNAP